MERSPAVEHAIERLALDAEDLRGGGLVARHVLEHRGDVTALELGMLDLKPHQLD